LEPLPSVTIAANAARQVAEGAPVYAPGVIDVEGITDESAGGGDDEPDDQTNEGPLVACYTPNGAAVALGQYVGDADADRGTVVSLERVLV
jgi:PUA domain.